MIKNIMNKSHFLIEIDGTKFPPYKEVFVNVGITDEFFKKIRSNRNLRVEKFNNQDYIKKHNLINGKNYNFIYDSLNQHAGESYKYVIERFSETIIENLPKDETGFFNRPCPGVDLKALNVRFFSSKRINEQCKCPVGNHDIFYSHGIGDKNYWIGNHIQDFKYAFVPGKSWEKRMRDTGYKGEIFIVGYTKLDKIFQNKIKKTKYEKPCIAWLPTHGYSNKNKGRSSYPFFENHLKEIRKDFIVIDGKHPTTKMHNKLKQLPTMQSLIDADIVIADGGSTIYEAWILGKPVIFPDWICKDDILNHFSKDKNNFEYKIYSENIGYHAKNMKHFNELLDIIIENGMKDEEKEFIENICSSSTYGNAGKLFAKSLIDIRKSL